MPVCGKCQMVLSLAEKSMILAGNDVEDDCFSLHLK